MKRKSKENLFRFLLNYFIDRDIKVWYNMTSECENHLNRDGRGLSLKKKLKDTHLIISYFVMKSKKKVNYFCGVYFCFKLIYLLGIGFGIGF